MSEPSVLTLDLETFPNVGAVFELRDQNISPKQLLETGRVVCWAAKWRGKPKVHFRSEFHNGREEMLERAYDLVSTADIVWGYNHKAFDMPWLYSQWAQAKLDPPAPGQDVDWYRVVKQRFRLPAGYSLAQVCDYFGLPPKEETGGIELWLRCMAGDARAWAVFKKYCKNDVVITEQLGERLLPWVKNHPHVGLYDGKAGDCPNCGEDALTRQGHAYIAQGKYPRFKCAKCGKWTRGTKSELRATVVGI